MTDAIEKISSIIRDARVSNRFRLVGSDANELLSALELSVIPEKIALTPDEAANIASALGYPVVLKIYSPDILHKSDIGGVITEIKSENEVRQAYSKIVTNFQNKAPGKKFSGVLVQSQVRGIEVIVGGKRDEVFGPIVLFGLGGIWVEVMNDVSIRLCPVSDSAAREMIREIRSFSLLNGSRGAPAVDLDSVAHTIKTVSSALERFPEILDLEINPLVVMPDHQGAVCVDARVYLDEAENAGKARGNTNRNELSGEAFQDLFSAKRIAVVGGSSDVSKIGGRIVSHISHHGYEGELLIVNPKESTSGPVKSFPSLASVPGNIDAALIVTPAEAVINVVRECSGKGVKIAVVYSSGFREIGAAGAERESRLRDAASKSGLRLVGPNTIGAIRPYSKLQAEFTANTVTLEPGNAGLATQSGAIGASLMDMAHDAGLRLSGWISTGNEADLEMADAIDYFVKDDQTRVVVCYLESITNGDKLKLAASEALAAKKPLIVYKAGSSQLGKNLAKSHTGAVAVDDKIFNAFAREYGIVRADELNMAMEFAKAFSMQPLPKGNRLAVVSVSGGANVIISDVLSSTSVTFPELSQSAHEKLIRDFPDTSLKNPFDMSANVMRNPQLVGKAIDTMMQEEVDALIVVVTTLGEPQGSIISQDICKALKYGRPIVVASPFPHSIDPQNAKYLQDHSVPVFHSIEKTARCVAAMMEYSKKVGSVSDSLTKME